jgi:predicted acylesterase/phospholipase RssA/tetratricopeptide (TPR) repeat protein
MTTRNELLAARENLSNLRSSPEMIYEAVRLLQKNGDVTEVRKLLAARVNRGFTDETTRLLNVEFTLRDVEGLGDSARLAAVRKLLDAEEDEEGKLNPAFRELKYVWDKQDALYEAESMFSRKDKGSGKELVDLAKRLKKHSVFADARRVFEVAKEKDDLTAEKKLYARQQEALCTYKDPTMPRAQRLDDAITLLKNDLDTNPKAETLGLAGAIYKRKWEIGNRVEDLEKALEYYLKGHKESSRHEPARPGNSHWGEDPQMLYRNDDWDAGYTGINAAFVMDRLAALEPNDEKAEELRSGARALRESLVDQLTKFHDDPHLARKSKDDWWLLVTLVEASLGLALSPRPDVADLEARFQPVEHWIIAAQNLESIPPWEFRSTVSQLVELTRVLDIDLPADDPVCKKTRETLEDFLGPHSAGLDTVLRGKIGLALSGGGFRASLFHIGVLAKLAELDVLRQVEVISCVSGGSIIGTNYYLELRKWLHEHEDSDVLDKPGEIDRQHYVDIVKRVQCSFLAGVQKNLRVRLATHIKTGFLTLLRPSYSRTERLGELYHKHLFSQVEDGEGHRPRVMDELVVEPRGTQPMAFVPPRDNWLRRTPVPVLLLNATTLNTGHNWQFTTTWMGESRWSINEKIDGNARLRRPYYWQAPKQYRKFPLGRAVAASSCVPGLFEPIILPKLYPGYTVRLVDGGVHDNQGVAGLLEQDCSWLIVSDASGQMTTVPLIDGGSLKSYGRMSNILMARVREEQLKGVQAKVEDRRVCGAVTVHLREGLSVEEVTWMDYEGEHPQSSAYSHAMKDLRKDVLEPLSGIRTDLDSFHDTEAYALMAVGYKMIEAKSREFEVRGLGSLSPQEFEWDFLELVPPMTDRKNEAHEDLKQLLHVGASSGWKIWRLEPIFSLLKLLLVLAVVAGIGWGMGVLFPGVLARIGSLWPGAICILAGLTGVKMISNRLTLGHFFARHALSSTLFSVVLLLLWPIAWIHLLGFDRRYLARGRVV